MIRSDSTSTPAHAQPDRGFDLRPWLLQLASVGAIVIIAFLTARFGIAFVFTLALLSCVVLMGLRWPWLAVPLLIASVPAQQYGSTSGITFTRLSLLAALAMWLLALAARRERIIGSPLLLPWMALLGWMFVSLAGAHDLGAAASEWLRWVIAFVALLLLVSALAAGGTARLLVLLVALGIAGAGEAMLGIAQGVLGIAPESFLLGDGGVARAYGTFGRPNSFAGYLELSVFPVAWVVVGLLPELRRRWDAWQDVRPRGFLASSAERCAWGLATLLVIVLSGSAGVMLGGIALSFSRGAWVGVAVGVLISASLWFRRWIPLALAALPLLLLLALLVGSRVLPASVADRTSSILDEVRPFDASSITITEDNFATVERMAHWQAGWRMWKSAPLTGIGPGNFNERYPDYFVRNEFRFSQGHAHNIYIHLLAETGLIGLLCYVAGIVALIVGGVIAALRVADPVWRAAATGAVGTMSAAAMHQMFEHLHVLNLGITMAISWAIVIIALRQPQHSVARDTHGATRGVEYSRA